MNARDEPAPIVVAGEALADLILGPDLSVDAHVGGGPFNTARTVARLGQPAAFLGPLSRDAFGESLAAALSADGVAVHPALRTELPTTLAMVALDDAGVAQYRFYAEGTSAPALDAERLATAVPEAMYALQVGGLGLVFEPSASSLLGLLRRLRGSTLICVDPNSRPHAIADLDAHRKVIRTAIECADIVKFSDEDAQVLAPDVAPEDTAREFLKAGPALVVLTRGAQGALALTHEHEITVDAPDVEVVDTVGAGDAFSGALLADLRRQGATRAGLGDAATVRPAIEFAAAVSAIVCTRAGADPPHLSEVASTA